MMGRPDDAPWRDPDFDPDDIFGRPDRASPRPPEPPPPSSYEEADAEVAGEFEAFLAKDESQFVRFPWTTVDAMMGGMLPGEVHYVGAFSGNGKTLFMLSLAREWAQRMIGVHYLGLETTRMALRTQLICYEAQINPAPVLRGDAWRRADWPVLKNQLLWHSRGWTEAAWPLYLSPAARIDLPALRKSFEHAVAMGARVLMVDHVDHLGTGTGGNLYQESVAVNNALKDFAEAHNMLVIASTQLSNEAVRNSPLDRYLPPLEHYIKFGGHKREIATTMMGLYRPLKPSLTKDQLLGARNRTIEARTLVEDWMMGVSCMKHRKDGTKDGTAKVVLGTDHYRISDISERDRHSSTDLRSL
jgi:hypothetical protein